MKTPTPAKTASTAKAANPPAKAASPPGPRPALSKSDLVSSIKLKHDDLPTVKVSAIIDTIMSTITGSLVRGHEVRLTGLGSFIVTTRKARIAQNPHTREKMAVPAKKTVRFKVSKVLKDSIAA